MTATVIVLVVVGVAALVVLTSVATAAAYRQAQSRVAERLSDVIHRLPPAAEPTAATTGVEAALAEAERVVGAELDLRHRAVVIGDRLSAALSVVPHGVIVSDERGAVCYRNARSC